MGGPVNGPRIVILERHDLARAEMYWQMYKQAGYSVDTWARVVANAVSLGLGIDEYALERFNRARAAERIAFALWHLEEKGCLPPVRT